MYTYSRFKILNRFLYKNNIKPELVSTLSQVGLSITFRVQAAESGQKLITTYSLGGEEAKYRK